MSSPQTLNKIIVVGLIGIAFAILAIIAFRPTDNKEMETILSNLTSGFLGFLGSSVAHAYSVAKANEAKEEEVK